MAQTNPQELTDKISRSDKKGLTRNREAAGKLGAKGMITICPGCLCMSQE
jgi:hypothetical protein